MMPGSATESMGGRYRLEDRVTSGPSADVWRATDLELSRPVAVKLLHSRSTRDAGALDRFRDTASCTASLVHEGIVRVFDYGEPDSADSARRPFLVMELVDGPSLAELLASGRVDPGRVMDVVAQAAAALDVAHQAGCAHGALGPQNILLSQDGRVKLIGFGSGHLAGNAPGSAAGDLHALGVVAEQCLTGSEGPGDAALALPRRIPAPVAEFISQLTARGPAAGLVTAAEVSSQAARLRDQLTPLSPDVTAVSLPARPAPPAAAEPPGAVTAPATQVSRTRRAASRPRVAAMPTFAVVALALAAAALFGVLKPHRDTAQAGGTAMITSVRRNSDDHVCPGERGQPDRAAGSQRAATPGAAWPPGPGSLAAEQPGQPGHGAVRQAGRLRASAQPDHPHRGHPAQGREYGTRGGPGEQPATAPALCAARAAFPANPATAPGAQHVPGQYPVEDAVAQPIAIRRPVSLPPLPVSHEPASVGQPVPYRRRADARLTRASQFC